MQPAPGLAEMRRLVTGFSLTIAISAVAELGLADHLVNGPKSAAELARLCGVQEDFLRRVLRYLASEGVFEERPGDLFALTERSHWLRSDVPGSLRPRATFAGSRYSWSAWGNLLQSLRSGTSAFRAAFGEDIFDYLKHDDVAAATFNSFMAGQTAASVDAVLAAYDFTGARELADIGGGRGALVAGVLKANPAMRGLLFDLPDVIATAGPLVAQAGVADRCKLVGGSFFESVPAGADLYVLKFILHDWTDEDCVRILENCRRAMASGALLLIVEHVIPEESGPHVARFMDINMMVMTSGRERTRREFERLLAPAGFAVKRQAPTALGFCILECVIS
jgi:O-methyltransferase domain